MIARVSVAVPAYQAARYIREALESVLTQLPANSEVVVVDDGSTDDTAAIAESFGGPVRVIREIHRGIAATVNRAYAETSGSIIASIDADDRWLPGKMEQSLAILDREPAVGAVFCGVRQFKSPDLEDETRFEIPAGAMAGVIRGAMVLRREWWERVGEMETELTVGEFVSWYGRAVDAGLVARSLDEVLYERRVHAANTMVVRRHQAADDYLRLIKATLDRRRAAARERQCPAAEGPVECDS